MNEKVSEQIEQCSDKISHKLSYQKRDFIMSDTQDNKSTGSAVLDFDIPPTRHVILGGDDWENLEDSNLVAMTEIALRMGQDVAVIDESPLQYRMVVPGQFDTTSIICLNKYGDQSRGFYGSVSAAIPGYDGPGITKWFEGISNHLDVADRIWDIKQDLRNLVYVASILRRHSDLDVSSYLDDKERMLVFRTSQMDQGCISESDYDIVARIGVKHIAFNDLEIKVYPGDPFDENNEVRRVEEILACGSDMKVYDGSIVGSCLPAMWI